MVGKGRRASHFQIPLIRVIDTQRWGAIVHMERSIHVRVQRLKRRQFMLV